MRPRAIHPGEHLAVELATLKMSADELARKLGLPTGEIVALVDGQRGITDETARRLAEYFGTSAEFWSNLQRHYERRVGQG